MSMIMPKLWSCWRLVVPITSWKQGHGHDPVEYARCFDGWKYPFLRWHVIEHRRKVETLLIEGRNTRDVDDRIVLFL